MPLVGFVLKRKGSQAESIARELASWLAARGCVACVAEELAGLVPGARAVPEALLAEHVDLLVVLGGDGTLLHGASLVGTRRVPLLGVNLGHLGFLTPFDPAEAQDALDRALRGELPLEARMRLLVTLRPADGGPAVERRALNDAVVGQGAMARLIEVVAMLDGAHVTLYRADGLIVSTPTGSTAYNLAAGGPILTPGQSTMTITPISPHTLTNRPLVVPATSQVVLELQGDREAVLTIDGQWARALRPGDQVHVSRAEEPILLYRSEKPYFDILREKLSWGERQGNG